MSSELILAPSDFVALLNQTLEVAYPSVIIEGELTNFRLSKNKWLYFDLQDELASVKFFGAIYNLPGPLEDGLKVRVIGSPRLHPRFGFSINIQNIALAGEGSIKKAAQLLRAKLDAEGLFAPERKRPLPALPKKIGLITAGNSAAYGDFIKILDERWGGITVNLADIYVQGAKAPAQIIWAIEYFNELPDLPEVLVITRGGGSAEDLAAFSDERVVRAVAASRIPTVVAVGHEIDISLAELAADLRASTPSNAAQLLVPERSQAMSALASLSSSLQNSVADALNSHGEQLANNSALLKDQMSSLLKDTETNLSASQKLVKLFDPYAALRRGYAVIKKGSRYVTSIKQLKPSDLLAIQLADGTIGAKVERGRSGKA